MKPQFRVAVWWSLRALAICLIGWMVVVVGMSVRYVNALFNPLCPAAQAVPSRFESVQFIAEDGVRLDGWYLPARNGAVVILMDGHGGSRDGMLPEAFMLARHGYGVLTIGSRTCAGAMATLGFNEVDDLRGAINFLNREESEAKIAVLGFSAGGVAALQGAAEMPEIQAVVAEGNYANLWEEITGTPAAPYYSLTGQVQVTVGLLIWARLGVWPGKVSPINALSLITPRPVLLIHGEKEIVDTLGYQQYATAGEPKQLWVVVGASHGEYYRIDPQEYERRVIGFFDSAMGVMQREK